jgi:hypothetical protein
MTAHQVPTTGEVQRMLEENDLLIKAIAAKQDEGRCASRATPRLARRGHLCREALRHGLVYDGLCWQDG